MRKKPLSIYLGPFNIIDNEQIMNGSDKQKNLGV